MKRTTDTRAQYQLAMDEEGILLAAANILEQRLVREGALTDPNAAANYLKARCAALTHEIFGVVFLDTRHWIVATEHLFTCTVDASDVHSRVVVQKALQRNAAAVLLFHNHPRATPSRARRIGVSRPASSRRWRFLISGSWTTWCWAAPPTRAWRRGVGSSRPRGRRKALHNLALTLGPAPFFRRRTVARFLSNRRDVPL